MFDVCQICTDGKKGMSGRVSFDGMRFPTFLLRLFDLYTVVEVKQKERGAVLVAAFEPLLSFYSKFCQK